MQRATVNVPRLLLTNIVHAPYAGFCLAGCVFGAIGFLPLFGGPGYEAALAAGLVLPAITAASTALVAVASKEPPFERLCRGLATGAAFAVLGLLLTLLHGLRVGFCDATSGVVLFLLGPGFGACLAGAFGVLVGSLTQHFGLRRRRLVAIVGAVFGPLFTALFSVGRFYTSPMVFAFDPFVGFFAGPIYETIIDPVGRLTTYRVGTLLTLIALALGALGIRRAAHGRFAFRRPLRSLVWGLSLLFAFGSLAHTSLGPRLGHFQTTESIREALGKTLEAERCSVVADDSIDERHVRLLLDECGQHLGELEQYFGIAGTPRVTVFLFASAAQKGELMGASRTFIAKPWRNEVYLQQEGYPHPVLGHELAHVVAGQFGRGPFRVAGQLSGWVPDPGRIEGFAVAASPKLDAELELREWAAALKRLELLPRIDEVFDLGFLGAHSKLAYTTAGAFADWFQKAFGKEKARRWYGGESLSTLTGFTLGEVEHEFRADIARVHVAPKVLDAAKARFDRPGIFRRRCPHEVDALEQRAYGKLGAGDVAGAIVAFEALLALDRDHVDSLLGLAQCDKQRGAAADARRRLEELASRADLHVNDRARAEEALADLALLEGDYPRARTLYKGIAERILDEDHQRTLEVKGSVSNASEARAIAALLIGQGASEPGWDVAGPLLGAWAAASTDPLPRYLLGKNLFLRGRWDDAAPYVDDALDRGIRLDLVRREALRTRLFLACARGETPRARVLLDALLQEPGLGSGWREGLRRFGRRCRVSE